MPSPASSSEQVGEVVGLGLVEARRRLVEQQHLGPGGQRPAELDQAGEAGRHGVDALVGDGADADAVEDRLGLAPRVDAAVARPAIGGSRRR